MSRFSGCLVVLGTCNSWCHVGVCNSWIWDSEFHGSISLKGQFVGNTIESPPQGRQARKELKRMKLIKDKQDCWMAVPILVHHYIKIWNLPIFFEMRCSPKFTCLVWINYCLSSSILSTSSLLCTSCLLFRQGWKMIVLMFNFLESNFHLFLRLKSTSFSRSCAASAVWSDIP